VLISIFDIQFQGSVMRKFFRSGVIGFVLIAASPFALASRVNVSVCVDIAVDSSGKLVEMTFPKSLPEGLEEDLRKRAATWEFSVALRNGQPQESRSSLVFELQIDATRNGPMTVYLVAAKTGPRYVETIPPDYPLNAIHRRSGGEVIVRCRIVASGRCVDLKARPGNIDPVLVAAAMEAVPKWRFQPEQVAGQAVEAWVDVPIRFSIAGQHKVTKEEKATFTSEYTLAAVEDPAIKIMHGIFDTPPS
jgi:TonB family protein